MAVEILILSGARQGERIALDMHEFRVGAEQGCEIFFDPLHDRESKGRSAVFLLTEEGWFIRRTGGGEILVNQQPVVGLTHVRSGDVVRMSEFGPDFSFSIVARAGPPPVARPAATPILPPPAPPAGPTRPAKKSSAPPPEPVEPKGVSVAGTAEAGRSMAGMIVGAAAMIVVLLLVIVLLSRPPVVIVGTPGSHETAGQTAKPDRPSPPGPDAPSPSAAGRADGKSGAASPTASKPPPGPKPESLPKPEPPAEPPPAEKLQPPEKPEPPLESLRESVFLIQVEKAGRFWPFASGSATGETTILTTAREAVQLAQWQREGFKVWVTQPGVGKEPAEPDARDGPPPGAMPVRDIRVHGLFASLGEKPGDWIFVDLAVLTVEGSIPPQKRLQCASPEELKDVDPGAPVLCVGYTHEGERVTRHSQLRPTVTKGKVFLILPPQGMASSQGLLQLKAEMPPNGYGSAVVTIEGRLIGVFGESAQPAQGAPSPPENLQYAPLVTAELIASPKIWQPPPRRSDPR